MVFTEATVEPAVFPVNKYELTIVVLRKLLT